ncbi:MAG: hypothetical protein AAF709_19605, partial [Pseudomonadota bacterium]
MLFNRSTNGSNDKPRRTKRPAAAPIEAAGHAPLAVEQLRRTVDPASLGFASTAELQPITGLIGQDRALKAIEFGA